MSVPPKPFEVISEEEFQDLKDPAKPVTKVLVRIRTATGLLRTISFPKSKYGLANRERMIKEYLADLEKRRLEFIGSGNKASV